MNLVEKILQPLIWFCEKTGRVLEITGTGADTDVYLIRYYLFQNRFFNLFIHIFLRSDRDDMHDHPWNFGTYVVRGSYKEEVPIYGDSTNSSRIEIKTNVRSTTQARWATRNAEQLHRVKLEQEYTKANKDKATMTVCFTGPVRRDWGFVKNGEWVFWKKYLGLPEDAPSRG